MERVVLSENEIESLANGTPIQKRLSDGKVLSKNLSMMKDVAMPLINHDKKLFSNAEIENIKIASSMMADAFKLGV